MFKRVILYLTLIVTFVLILFAVLNHKNTHSLIPPFGVHSEPTAELVVEQEAELPGEPAEGVEETLCEPQCDTLHLATPTDTQVGK